MCRVVLSGMTLYLVTLAMTSLEMLSSLVTLDGAWLTLATCVETTLFVPLNEGTL